MEYFAIEIILLLIFFCINTYYKQTLFQTAKQFIWFWIIAFIIGIGWDYYAISQGHWVYSATDVLGIYFGVMPLEDIVFIILIPYGVLTVFKLITEKIFPQANNRSKKN